GKGVASLDTIAEKRLSDDEYTEYGKQLDPLCRSIWTFINARQAFEDAESFYFARQYRDHGKMYDAFEVELGSSANFDANSVDEAAVATKITEVLELKTKCTVTAMDLPTTDAHPASVMLIVRHGGPLSSVHDHRDDGRRGTIYFRPPNEATLIYTPAKRQIEICADSPAVRQHVSGAFAEVALNHDVSQKPLTWKSYNLGRFRNSLTLPVPRIDGFEIHHAKVFEVEVRLGNWSRKLSLKVAIDDDIDAIATTYLGSNSIIRRAAMFSRIGIAIKYNKTGEEKERTLNVTISGSKSCNLQSNKDPDERSLGFTLLSEWGILNTFRQIENGDLRAMFPKLVRLFDREDDEITGGELRELDLDPDRLIEGGLIERRDRQDIVLIDEDDIVGEAAIEPSATPGMVKATGPFGEDAGEYPLLEMERFQLNRQWLQETVLRLVGPLLTKKGTQIIDQDLILLGDMGTDGTSIPVYFARRLGDSAVINKLDQILRARNTSGIGVVLSASPAIFTCLGPNVVVPILSHLEEESEEQVLSRGAVIQTLNTGRNLAMGGSAVSVLKSDAQSASLCIPGKPPLAILGANQIRIFECLAAAHQSGSPDVKTAVLIEDTGVQSPQQAFRKPMWDSILDVYIGKGPTRGYWRLVV
ncbi:MAG TPA: hypothetical protein DIT67_12535, partial [Octadecabacter sp.]|nr:hypothetical protein [Octadecabacter sp.]